MVLAGVLILAGIAGGGYFVYVSAAADVILLCMGLYRILRTDRILLAWDGNLLALGVVQAVHIRFEEKRKESTPWRLGGHGEGKWVPHNSRTIVITAFLRSRSFTSAHNRSRSFTTVHKRSRAPTTVHDRSRAPTIAQSVATPTPCMVRIYPMLSISSKASCLII